MGSWVVFWVDLSLGRNFKKLSFVARPAQENEVNHCDPLDPSLCLSPPAILSRFSRFTEPEHLKILIHSRLVRAQRWAGKGDAISAFAEGKADEGARPLLDTTGGQGSRGCGS